MSKCPAHTDDQHRYDMKCACGEKGTVVLSIVADGEVVHIGPKDAFLFTTDSLAAALRQVAHDLKWCKHSDEWHAVAHPDPAYPHEDRGPDYAADIIKAAKEAERE